MKEKIRPLFGQLGSLHEQIPQEDKNIQFNEIKGQIDRIISALNDITQEDYSSFGVIENYESAGQNNILYANTVSIRSQLGGLIGRLGATYFADEQKVSVPGTQVVFTQQNNQSQNVQISIVLELQELLLKKENDFPKGSTERSFIEKIKTVLPTITNVTQLLAAIFDIAKASGLDEESLRKIFG